MEILGLNVADLLPPFSFDACSGMLEAASADLTRTLFDILIQQ